MSNETIIDSIDYFSKCETLVIDTETTGLRPYHGDKIFSIIIGEPDGLGRTVYYNFNEKMDGLDREILAILKQKVFSTEKLWIGHNLKFDMHFLAKEGIELKGSLWCTMIMERLLDYNLSEVGRDFSLDKTTKRYDTFKEDIVSEYIAEKKLYTDISFDWKKTKERRKHFDQVPLSIIVPYGIQDVKGTASVYRGQKERIPEIQRKIKGEGIFFQDVVDNEMQLIRTIFNMEKIGVYVDRDFCLRAIEDEQNKQAKSFTKFSALCGEEFSNSPTQMKRIFADIRGNWVYGEPSKIKKIRSPKFDAEALRTFNSPLANAILSIKNSNSNINYFQRFLHYCDADSVIHTNFNQHLPRTGRLSSNNPNMQNLRKEPASNEYAVRRAFVPRKGKFFLMVDFDQMEYKLMYDYANPEGLVEKVNNGFDCHQETADSVGISRAKAKTVNFGLLYKLGKASLASSLGVSEHEASLLKDKILTQYKAIARWISAVDRGVVVNGGVLNTWLGRVFYIKQRNEYYKAINALIQGGCADVIKRAMNNCSKYLEDKNATLLLQVHDELIFEIEYRRENLHVCEDLIAICEESYPYKHCKLTASADTSSKSLADKVKFEGSMEWLD